MKTTIKFNTDDSDSNPWKRPQRPSYEDHILKPEFKKLQLRFENGETWLRILPSVNGSAYGWLFPIQTLKYKNGQFAHPRTLRPNAKSVFDHAYSYLREFEPQLLYSKVNKTGARLLSSPRCAFWAIVYSETGDHALKLVVESGYDGTRGGARGLGYEIWRKVNEKDENGEPVNNAVHPHDGVLICVERSKPQNADYANYSVRIGRQRCPVDELLEKVNPADTKALCPLEQVIHDPSEEEQWTYLSAVLTPEMVTKIRANILRRAS